MARRPRAWPPALALALVLLSLTGHSVSAQTDDDDGDSVAGSSAAAASASLNAGAAIAVKQLTNSGDAMLIRRNAGFWSDAKTPICQNGPFILSRDGPSNLNCLPPMNDLGLSCTCLAGFVKRSETWKFRIAKKLKTTGTPPKTVTPTSALAVTKIAPFAMGQAVKTLEITGDGSDVVTMSFADDVSRNGEQLAPMLETTKGQTNVTAVHFENIDVGSAIAKPDFFQPRLTDLSVRKCNLVDGRTGFFSTLTKLEIVNLENNKLTKIPPELLQLRSVKQVFLGGNPITSATITEAEFQTIDAMKAFVIDPAASATSCPGGQLKKTGKVTFCVSNSDVPPQTDTSTTRPTGTQVVSDRPSSGTNKYLLIGAICGSVVIVALLFLILRLRSSRKKEEAFAKQATPYLLEDTVSFDQSKDSQEPGINSTLVNDPIIITHRIPHNDVKVATCISRGGFGLVYSGTFNRQRVAIKRIRPELSAEIKYIEAFLKEICLMASLQHPRIVEFVGVAWDSLRNLCAVTEFMERGDLRDVLQSSKERNARLTWDGHKARIAMHIAEALTYLHSLSPKVIHRDLKSKNVLLDSDMTAKLSDFGVSRERRFEETHMTAGIGTAFWIAPEVLLGMDYDERADIFSFGVVLSEIDTDDYPYWNEKNPASGGKQQENVILRMVATGALRPEFSPACPSAIVALGQSCLDVDPQKRPTAAEIVYCLQQLIRSSPLTTESAFSSNEW